MPRPRRITPRDRLLAEIADFREAAFPQAAGHDAATLAALEMERGAVVRGRILSDCALMEELAALVIMHYVLSDCPRFTRLKYFGRIKKYRLFYEDVLGRLTARQKLAFLRKTAPVPKSVAGTVERMLALRDLLAHVLTIEDHADSVKWKGTSV
jgi:hypothetical protein